MERMDKIEIEKSVHCITGNLKDILKMRRVKRKEQEELKVHLI